MMLTPKPLPPQVDLTPQTNQTMPLTPPQPQAEEKTVLLSAVPNPDYTASASGSFNKNSAKQMNGEAGSKLQSIFSFCEKHLQKK